jgi:hypothetical protein
MVDDSAMVMVVKTYFLFGVGCWLLALAFGVDKAV